MSNWTVPPPKLDTEQRDFLENHLFSGKNYWISGFPGAGKSTILAHAIRLIKADRPRASIFVVVFTRSLIEMFQAAFKEMGLGTVRVDTMFGFMRSGGHYDYILCDEVQDLTPHIINAMRERSDCLIVAGDQNQSIYKTDPQYNQPTVAPSQIKGLINGETFTLTIVHRLSPAIHEAVKKLVPALASLAMTINRAESTTQIRTCEAKSIDDELQYVWNESLKAPSIGKTSAILLPNQESAVSFIDSVTRLNGKSVWDRKVNKYGKTDFGGLNDYLESQEIKLHYVGNGYGSFNQTNNVFVMTYWSAKGLDFDNVFIPYSNDRLFITSNPELSKRVFMVAMTRSRNNLYLSYTGRPHPYLRLFPANLCARIDITNSLHPTSSSSIGF